MWQEEGVGGGSERIRFLLVSFSLFYMLGIPDSFFLFNIFKI